jgi:uncharacterized protein
MAWYRHSSGAKKIVKYLREINEVKTTPAAIALGFAMGTFFAILPLFGASIVVGLLFLLLFRKVNKLSMLIAFAVWNPLTLIPIYYISFRLGDWILGNTPMVEYELALLDRVYHVSRRLLLGSGFLAIAMSIASYAGIYILARTWQRRLHWHMFTR